MQKAVWIVDTADWSWTMGRLAYRFGLSGGDLRVVGWHGLHEYWACLGGGFYWLKSRRFLTPYIEGDTYEDVLD